MGNRVRILVGIFVVLLCSNCVDDDLGNTSPETSFIDHGFIPAEVEMTTNVTPFQSAIFHDKWVIVATNDGLWKNDLETKEWSRAGFEGKKMSLIYKHPDIDGKLFAGTRSEDNSEKPLHISEDGGETWQEVAEPLTLFEGGFESFTSLAVRPGNPDQVYANMEGGAMIGVSLDGGMTWTRMNYATEEYWGYTSNIAFLPNDPDHLFQGSENPLDIVWLARYDINEQDPILLENYTQIITLSDWGNRRPTELKTYSFDPNTLYVGQEGALSKVTGDTFEFIYKSEEGGNFPYSYIYGIWVNPENTEHIIFGGSVNHSEQPMSLYETRDGGTTVNRIEDKLGLDNPEIFEIVHTNSYPAIVINDKDRKKVKLVLYQYE